MSYPSPDQLHATFAELLAAHDVDALLDLYESDAIQLQQDGTVLRGVEALRGVFQWLVDANLQMQGTQREPLIVGDVALTSTLYESESVGPDGSRVTVRIVTAEVSRRQADGTWRVVIDAPYFA